MRSRDQYYRTLPSKILTWIRVNDKQHVLNSKEHELMNKMKIIKMCNCICETEKWKNLINLNIV